MAYSDKFDREVILEDLDEATEIIVKAVMKEGELRFRDALALHLEKEISSYLESVDGEPNIEWIDGVSYVIKLIRDGDFDESE